MPVFLLHSMKLLFTKPIPPNPAPSKIIPIISETLYIYLIGFQQETERRQGMFVIASFDRMFTRERKNQDGTFTKTHYVGLIIRSETETRLCEVRTKHPEKYEGYKPQQIVSMQVFPRAFKDNIYFSDEA